jgi:6-hydroxycyclohex-1-ene-1-carbonyl-CoA dehydrogenase
MMTAPGAPLERRTLPLPEPAAGEALIEVAGCGLCHTDLSFLHHGVKTRAPLPLVLGHEISGTVRAVGPGVDPSWPGRPVLVPAVLPCGECELCRGGRRTICRAQVMPGNDRHGGFASHLTVPARFLVPVADDLLQRCELWELAIVSDAVTTPFQAVRRSGLAAGELAVVVGCGGIGLHAVQIAVAAGAKVVGLDVGAKRLEQASQAGAGAAIDVRGKATKEIVGAVREAAAGLGAPKHGWKIYETSGTRAGQETAFALLGFGSTLAVVGFTMDRLELRLSNLMAFDATAFGNWGCDPLLYAEVLDWIAAGRIGVSRFVRKHRLDDINDVIATAERGELVERAVLVP